MRPHLSSNSSPPSCCCSGAGAAVPLSSRAATVAAMSISSALVASVANMKWSKFLSLWTYTWACVFSGSAPRGACGDGAGGPSCHTVGAGAWIMVPGEGPVATFVWEVAARTEDELVTAETSSDRGVGTDPNEVWYVLLVAYLGAFLVPVSTTAAAAVI